MNLPNFGVFVPIVLATVMCGCSASNSTRDSSQGKPAISDECSRGLDSSLQAGKDYQAGDYAGGYKNAQTALSLTNSCPGGMRVGLGAVALSARAWNERHLPQGDSVSDLRGAYALLKKCIDDPLTVSMVTDLCTSTARMDGAVAREWGE
jgi:hypothetical protein